MKTKRFISLLLGAVMAFSLAVPAFATNTATTTQTTDVTGDYKPATINLIMADTSDFVVNPYGLKYKASNGEYYTDQIANATKVIANKTQGALAVVAKVQVIQYVAGTDSGQSRDSELVLVDEFTGEGAKEARIWLAAGNVNGWNAELEAPEAAPLSVNSEELADGAINTEPRPLYLTYTSDNSPVDTIEGRVGTLAACNPDYPDDVTYMGYRFFGEVVTAPEKAWTDQDRVKVKITWTFNGAATSYVDKVYFHDTPYGTKVTKNSDDAALNKVLREDGLNMTTFIQPDAMEYKTGNNGTTPDYQITDIVGLVNPDSLRVDDSTANAVTANAARGVEAEYQKLFGHVHILNTEPFVKEIALNDKAFPGDSYSITGTFAYTDKDNERHTETFRLIHRVSGGVYTKDTTWTAALTANFQSDVFGSAQFSKMDDSKPITVNSVTKTVKAGNETTVTTVDKSKVTYVTNDKKFTIDKSLIEDTLAASGDYFEIKLDLTYAASEGAKAQNAPATAVFTWKKA